MECALHPPSTATRLQNRRRRIPFLILMFLQLHRNAPLRQVRLLVQRWEHRCSSQRSEVFPEGCDSAKLLAECDSPAAQQVKSQISAFAKDKGPRQVFDYIIETWGEKALSDQALQIRKQVRGK